MPYQRSRAELRADLDKYRDEVRAIDEAAGDRDFTREEEARFRAAEANFHRAADEYQDASRRAEGLIGQRDTTDRPISDRANGAGNPARDHIMRSLDDYVRSGHLPGYAAERVERLISSGPQRDQSNAAKWALAAGDPAYARAFAKLAADPTRGHMMWTPEEGAAYRRAEEVRTALNLTGGASMVPLVIDPAIMLTNAGSNNPLRQISRVVQTVSDSWNGVTSAGATAEWKTEGSQAADGTPGLAAAPIPVFMGDVNATYSYEVGMDALNFLSEIEKVVRDAADNLMATAYTTGGGSTAPKGIVTALAGTASEINTTGSEALDDSDPFALQNALPARYSANASFMSHIATANAYRQMETTAGALQFPELRQTPPMLLGKPWHENSNMDGAINVTATSSNYVVVYGDFSQFVIVDRIGATVEILPVFGDAGRPTGQRQMFMTFRTGSDAPVIEAFRLLDVPTTA
ncbi:phage major capsid protein [Nonomuraea fuscirosea]